MLKSTVFEENSNRGPSEILVCAQPREVTEREIRVTMTTLSGTAEGMYNFSTTEITVVHS